MTYKIINKNALDALKEMPDESIDCVITSPPYYGLRSYKGADTIWGENTWKGQLGLEPTFQMYIEHLMMITKEIKRVLKKTGTVFWNMGDSYASSGGSTRHRGYFDPKWKNARNGSFDEPTSYEQGIPPKSLMMIPERFAIAMIDDGWILRNKIIWHKPNGMPSSVKDRFSNKWEYVFFFTKSRKYYFDLDAVRKPLAVASIKRISQKNIPNQLNTIKIDEFGKEYPNMNIKKILNNMHQKYEQNSSYEGKPSGYFNEDGSVRVNQLGANPGDILETPYHPKGDPTIHGQRLPPQPGQKGAFNPKGVNPGDVFESKYIYDKEAKTASPAGRVMRNLVDGKTTTLVREAITNVNQYLKDKLKESGMSIKELAEISGEPETQIAHYFRTDESGCALPNREFWDKVKDVLGLEEYDKHIKEEYKSVMLQFNPLGSNPGDVIDNEDAEDFMSIPTLPHPFAHFAVYPETLIVPLIKAGCPKGGIVLDPFAGSGTTGVVAEILGRDSVLIEISPEYIKIIEDRMKTENIEKVRQMLIKKGMIEK